MRWNPRFAPGLFAAALAFVLSAASVPTATAARYVCPPCGAPCDTLTFDKPGICPGCGMQLIDAATATAIDQSRQKVAILIFNAVEIIDYTGPWEVFGAANFDVFTVAATRDPVTTAMGMTVVPKYTFADAPPADVLLIPGGGVRKTADDAATLAWIRKASAGTQQTMSVCNGAFILANTGLLDGLTATTTWSNLDRMRAAYPKIRVVNDQRFVDNGKLITTGGLSAGIDGALHVVSKLHGEGEAQQVALSLEYDWRPKTPYLRAAFADQLIPNLNLDRIVKFKIRSTQGDAEHWDAVLDATTHLTATQLMDSLSAGLTGQGKWVRVSSSAPAGAPTTKWKFSDPDGRPWSGTVSVEPVAGQSGAYTATLNIVRVRKAS